MPLTRVHHEALARPRRKRAIRTIVQHKQSAPPPAPPFAPAPSPTPPAEPEAEPGQAAPAVPPADTPPEAADVFVQRAFQSRLDAAQGRLQTQNQDDGLETLLDKAITLLETISLHPALRDYSANLRKIEEIEQRLMQGAYPN